jgi:anti-anti-sigma factor
LADLFRWSESRYVMIPFHQVRTVRTAPDTVRVLLSGEIDMSVQEELRNALRAVVAGPAGVIEVDLHHVAFLDCAVIGELVRAHLDARLHGQILVATRPQGFVRELLELANVLALLTPRPAALSDGDTTSLF